MKKIVMLAIIIAGLCSCGPTMVITNVRDQATLTSTGTPLELDSFFVQKKDYVLDESFMESHAYSIGDKVKNVKKIQFFYFDCKKINLSRNSKNLKKVFKKNDLQPFDENDMEVFLYRNLVDKKDSLNFLTKGEEGNLFLCSHNLVYVFWGTHAQRWFVQSLRWIGRGSHPRVFVKSVKSKYKWIATTKTEYKKVKVN